MARKSSSANVLLISQLCEDLREESSRPEARLMHRPRLGRFEFWNAVVKGEVTAPETDPSVLSPSSPLLKFLKHCPLFGFYPQARLKPFDQQASLVIEMSRTCSVLLSHTPQFSSTWKSY